MEWTVGGRCHGWEGQGEARLKSRRGRNSGLGSGAEAGPVTAFLNNIEATA